ncbi:MAG TPA: tetratricopeptide repeat protein [Allocoleopsis sp.]
MNYYDFEQYEAFCERGKELVSSGYYEEALACYDRAITLAPNYHMTWILRGGVLTHLDRYSEAKTSFEQALKLQPNDKDAWLFFGLALQHLGQHKQAYTAFDEALGTKQRSLRKKLKQAFKKRVYDITCVLFDAQKVG